MAASSNRTAFALLGVCVVIIATMQAWLVYAVARAPWMARPSTRPSPRAPEGGGSCGGGCGAIDPVSDPAYNMREVAKQSVLLEEHLVQPNKYCVDCIGKHFLHAIGLAEEAEMLASGSGGGTVATRAAQTAASLRALMDAWQAAASDPAVVDRVAAAVRAERKRLVSEFVTHA